MILDYRHLSFFVGLMVLFCGCVTSPSYTPVNVSPEYVDIMVGNFSLNTTVPFPSQKNAPVLVTVNSSYSRENANSLAKSLGMSGDPQEAGDIYFVSKEDAEKYSFSVKKDTSLIEFQKFDARTGIAKSESQSISAAKEFLIHNNLLPPGTPEPRISNNSGDVISPSGERHLEWLTHVVSFHQFEEGLPVLSSQMNVEVDSEGNIIGLFRSWREYKPIGEVPLKSPEDAIKEFRDLIGRKPGKIPDKVEVTRVVLGYDVLEDGSRYLYPVYWFGGYNRNGGHVSPFDPVEIAGYYGSGNQSTDSPDMNTK